MTDEKQKYEVEKIEPYSERYRNLEYSMLKGYAPAVYPCQKCGHPVIKGYCCTNCRDSNPSEK
jgi:hypothetical protein